MAVKTNTSTSVMNTAYGALAKKVKNTTENMDKLLMKMGCKNPADVKRVPMIIPEVPGSKDDVLFLGINGAKFYFKRGESVLMPEPLLRLAVDCKEIPKHYLDMLDLLNKQSEATAAAQKAAAEAEIAAKKPAKKTAEKTEE